MSPVLSFPTPTSRICVCVQVVNQRCTTGGTGLFVTMPSVAMRNLSMPGSHAMGLSSEEKFVYGLRVSPSKRHTSENRPIFDARGWCHGWIIGVNFQESRAGEDGKSYGPSFKWELTCPGTIKRFSRFYWTWTRQRVPKPGEGNSAFMDLCLRLGVVHDIYRLLDTDIDVSRAVGLPVTYTLIRKGDVYRVDGASITLKASHAEQLEMWG